MGATTTYALPYPEPGDRPAGDEQLQALAEAIEATTAALNPDTGSVTNAPVLAAAGWEFLTTMYRVIGKVATLFLYAKRTGAPLTAGGAADPNPGNIPDTLFATITDPALRPSFNVYGKFRHSLTDGAFDLNASTGELELVSMHTGSTIKTWSSEESSNVVINIVYPVP